VLFAINLLVRDAFWVSIFQVRNKCIAGIDGGVCIDEGKAYFLQYESDFFVGQRFFGPSLYDVMEGLGYTLKHLNWSPDVVILLS